MSLFSSPPQSICVMRLSAVGDVCNAIAVVQAIQRQWPETEIVWVVGQLESELINQLKNIKVVVFDKKQGWFSYKKLWWELRHYQFDALLHMQYSLRASIATLGIKATYKVGFDAQRSQDLQTLFTNIKVPSPNSMHVLDGMLAFAKVIGVQDLTPRWNLQCEEQNLVWAGQYIKPDRPNLVIAAASSKAYKNWTASGYACLIEHAYALNWNVILAGSPTQVEYKLVLQIEGLLRHAAITNLVGRSTIKQMLALLSLSDVIVAPDSGPIHMANAVNTPAIGLYAHHSPERTGSYQYRQYSVSVYEEALCAERDQPFSKRKWRTRVKDKNAMERIHPEAVLSMFDRLSAELQKQPQVMRNLSVNGENQPN